MPEGLEVVNKIIWCNVCLQQFFLVVLVLQTIIIACEQNLKQGAYSTLILQFSQTAVCQVWFIKRQKLMLTTDNSMITST